jgi:hypothetical protein
LKDRQDHHPSRILSVHRCAHIIRAHLERIPFRTNLIDVLVRRGRVRLEGRALGGELGELLAQLVRALRERRVLARQPLLRAASASVRRGGEGGGT